MSINREGAPLISSHLTLKQGHMREKKRLAGGEKNLLLSLGSILSWLALVLVVESILKKLLGFLPCGFPEENICDLFCCCMCLSFSDPIAYGYDEIMLFFFNI